MKIFVCVDVLGIILFSSFFWVTTSWDDGSVCPVGGGGEYHGTWTTLSMFTFILTTSIYLNTQNWKGKEIYEVMIKRIIHSFVAYKVILIFLQH